ncbi:anti-sigma factor [Ottowia thiooxydans]|uniref:anti-sigma factor n=1 Tax=Ottowia thiooxydans TaxID=219182 RepID=UPI000410C3A8|nr:anti-sigma factor [Ottowia thiooxydans]
MKIHQNPELLDRLAASYALGTLRGPARRRFETIAREQAPVRAAALIWQSRMSSLNELQPSAQPAPVVWTRIDNLVRADREQATQAEVRHRAIQAGGSNEGRGGWLRSLSFWRVSSAVGAAATVAAVVVGLNVRQELDSEIATLQAAPQIQYVAVLADDKAAASMLVTFDAKNKKLILQRVGNYQESADRSLQLWALPPSGGPKSLGVLSNDKLLRLTAGESDVREVPTLAISLEPKGGVPSETGPTGPVLFKGALIQKLM